MEHVGWFFAGTSFGLCIGVFVTCLARVAGENQPETQPAEENLNSRHRLVLVRR